MEGSVGADGDARGDGDSGCHMCGAGVEFFTEINRFHTFTSQCWTDRWTGRCLSSTDNQLDDLICCLLGARHCSGGLSAWSCDLDLKLEL